MARKESSRRVRPDGGRVIVMESVPRLRSTTNPYLHQLVAALRSQVDVELFSWSRALFGKYDVFHVHWPELLSRGPSRPKTWGKRALTWLFQTRVLIRRTPVIRTAHNVAPHETGPKTERYLLRRWDRLTTAWIALNSETPLPAGAVRRLIPHGHYSDHYASQPHAEPVPHAVAMVGQVRPYKGVDALLNAFTGMDDTAATLIVAGAVQSAELSTRLRRLAGADERISLQLGYVDDPRLVEVVTAASLVVLPYTAMHNSGALLLALSLRRPVLAPRNAVTDALAAEVGERWVHRYNGELASGDLADALAAGIPVGEPDLSGRTWDHAGRAHVQVFEAALAERRAR